MASVIGAKNILENIDSRIASSENDIWYGSAAINVEQQTSLFLASSNRANWPSVPLIEEQLKKLDQLLNRKDSYQRVIDSYALSVQYCNELIARHNAGDESVTNQQILVAKNNVNIFKSNLLKEESLIKTELNEIKYLGSYNPSRIGTEYDIYKINITDVSSEIITGLNKAIVVLNDAKSDILASKYDSVSLKSSNGKLGRPFNIGICRDRIIKNIDRLVSNIERLIQVVQRHLDNITAFENGESVEIPLESSETSTQEDTSANTEPKKEEYKVQKGDTLVGIAATYGINWKELYDANKDKIPDGDPRKLEIGTNLVIPGVTSDSSTPVETTPNTEVIGNEKLEASSEIPILNPILSFNDLSKTNWNVECDNVMEGTYDAPMAVNNGVMVDKSGTPITVSSKMDPRYDNNIYDGPNGDYYYSHKGTDFIGGSNDKGTNISSIGPGVVIKSVDNQEYGLGHHVRVLHEIVDENGNVTYAVSTYAHLVDTNVEVGQVIDQNTVVGTLGNTGNSTGPHLHLELAKVPLTEEEVYGKTTEEILTLVQEKGIDDESDYGKGNYYDMGEYYNQQNLLG